MGPASQNPGGQQLPDLAAHKFLRTLHLSKRTTCPILSASSGISKEHTTTISYLPSDHRGSKDRTHVSPSDRPINNPRKDLQKMPCGKSALPSAGSRDQVPASDVTRSVGPPVRSLNQSHRPSNVSIAVSGLEDFRFLEKNRARNSEIWEVWASFGIGLELNRTHCYGCEG